MNQSSLKQLVLNIVTFLVNTQSMEICSCSVQGQPRMYSECINQLAAQQLHMDELLEEYPLILAHEEARLRRAAEAARTEAVAHERAELERVAKEVERVAGKVKRADEVECLRRVAEQQARENAVLIDAAANRNLAIRRTRRLQSDRDRAATSLTGQRTMGDVSLREVHDIGWREF